MWRKSHSSTGVSLACSDIGLGLAQEGFKNGLVRIMDKGPLPGL